MATRRLGHGGEANVVRAVRRVPGGDVLLCAPRAIAYARATRRRIGSVGGDDTAMREVPGALPLTAAALLDELTTVALRAAGRGLTRAEVDRIAGEVRDA